MSETIVVRALRTQEIVIIEQNPFEDELGNTVVGHLVSYDSVNRCWNVEYIETGDACCLYTKPQDDPTDDPWTRLEMLPYQDDPRYVTDDDFSHAPDCNCAWCRPGDPDDF